MESLNRNAVELVDEAIDFADELGAAVRHLDNDAVVIDFGVEAEGGIEAGLLLAEIATGGLATVGTRMGEVAGTPLPHVECSTDHPLLALLCSGKAAWDLPGGRASGPARLFVEDGPEFEYADHEEDFDLAALAVEGPELPDESAAEEVARRAGVPTSGVYLPTAPAASVAGSVAVAARAAEVAVARLADLGYDPRDVISATGSAPVAPVAADERTAIARGNDALALGGQVHLVVERDSAAFDDLPFSATGYDGSFEEILAGAGWSFEAAADAFAPAAVTVDVRGGPTRAVGGVDEEVLADQLGLCG